MEKFPEKLSKKLQTRKETGALRNLPNETKLVDFHSNDYLGFSQSRNIFQKASEILAKQNFRKNGAAGSRLLSGNSTLCETTESLIANFHEAEGALIFNSGYDANVGFFSSVPQRGDLVFYDEFIHASVRDGIQMSLAKAYKFKHNNLADLQRLCHKTRNDSRAREIFVVTESIFSMDGDSPNLKAFSDFCTENNCRLIVDEAHAVGAFGKNGEGLVQESRLHDQVFARIITFGKALGCHGSAILGSEVLKQYLINFSRSFIYTTALPPHSVATIQAVYAELKKTKAREKLWENITFFKAELKKQKLEKKFIKSNSAIQTCIIPGNEKVKSAAEFLQKNGFGVKPILSPTVPENRERLRFCLHSFNSKKEVSEVLEMLSNLKI